MNRLALALVAPAIVLAAPAAAQQSPRAAYASLLAAERDFAAAAAAQRDPVDGLAAMFAPDVTVPVRGQAVSGRDAVIAALRASPNYQGQHFSWRPIGGTVSADGTQGFTTGYADLQGAAAPERAGRRYLAYWVRRPEGWRVVAYRQLFRQASEQANVTYSTPLPARAARPDPARSAPLQAELSAAERAFSDRAQQVGLRQAFGEFGRPDAVHVAGENGFRVGLPAILAGFDQATTSPLHWATDRAIVASSGDLGVSIGTIRPNGAVPAGQPETIPYFTIWRRNPGGQWRYIAE